MGELVLWFVIGPIIAFWFVPIIYGATKAFDWYVDRSIRRGHGSQR